MNSARPINDEASAPGTGAAILPPGRLPAKLNTVTAEVLARLLRHERLTGLDGVSEASTTRLAAVVHHLMKKHGWPIETKDKAAGCRDGRMAWVVEYFITSDHIEVAMARGAAAWCASVRNARAKLRALAPLAYRRATKLNRQRAATYCEAQRSLFGNDGAAACTGPLGWKSWPFSPPVTATQWGLTWPR